MLILYHTDVGYRLSQKYMLEFTAIHIFTDMDIIRMYNNKIKHIFCYAILGYN